MLRTMWLSAALLACACAPAPARMPAAEASEFLQRFASGTGPDVCTDEGRALLRGAVRAYGAELASAGVAWPALPGVSEEAPNSVDVAVLVAFSAGFVDASDFNGAVRGMVRQLSFAQWPQIRQMRAAAEVACGQVLQLQQAASRFVLEMERYERMAARDGRSGERLARQAARMERARRQMEQVAAFVEAELEAARARRDA